MLNTYDRIAPIYDALAAIAFAGCIKKSQIAFINRIKNEHKILILGGGTGWILKEIYHRNPAVKLVYVEASQIMISKAKKNAPDLNVDFIHGTHDHIPNMEFDVVITNFFLDQFSNNDVERIVKKISPLVRNNGFWISTDFVDHTKWQRAILYIMYTFFKFSTGLRIKKLPNWRAILQRELKTTGELMKFYFGFIETHIFYIK